MPVIDEPANARSRRTRRALLEATRAILEEQGFEALTMSAVAEQAGISRRGAYLHFEGLSALIAELFEHVAAVEGLEESAAPVREAEDAVEALEAWARHAAAYHPRVMAVDRAIQRVESVNEAAAEHRARVSAKQMEICEEVVRSLADQNLLSPHWTVAGASDLLYGLLSTELFSRLIDHRDWSGAQMADRLVLLVHSALVTDPGPVAG